MFGSIDHKKLLLRKSSNGLTLIYPVEDKRTAVYMVGKLTVGSDTRTDIIRAWTLILPEDPKFTTLLQPKWRKRNVYGILVASLSPAKFTSLKSILDQLKHIMRRG